MVIESVVRLDLDDDVCPDDCVCPGCVSDLRAEVSLKRDYVDTIPCPCDYCKQTIKRVKPNDYADDSDLKEVQDSLEDMLMRVKIKRMNTVANKIYSAFKQGITEEAKSIGVDPEELFAYVKSLSWAGNAE